MIHAHVSPDEATAFETARHDANNAIGDFEQTKFTQRTIEDKLLESQVNQVRNRIEGLRKFYHPEGPEEWLNALASVATASNAINARWEAWRNVLRNDVPQMVANRDFFKERQKASELLRSLLVALDQTFPPRPADPQSGVHGRRSAAARAGAGKVASRRSILSAFARRCLPIVKKNPPMNSRSGRATWWH